MVSAAERLKSAESKSEMAEACGTGHLFLKHESVKISDAVAFYQC